MTAWIMVGSNGMPISRSMYDLYDGFYQLGEDIKLYKTEDVTNDRIPYTRDDIVVGHIGHCKRHVKTITGKEVKELDYPVALDRFMGRKVLKSKLGQIRSLMSVEQPTPIFVKSVEQKLITGFVCKSYGDYISKTNCQTDDTEVYISDVLDIRSEYRTYIHWHSIVDCRRYQGNYSLVPEKGVLDSILDSLKNESMPCFYSIDVCVLNNGETIVVECNDGFALGNYGVHARKYAEMHRDRWYQMIDS